jgi:putative serine protease PepD
MLDAKRTEEPIVTDGSAWRQPGPGAPASNSGWGARPAWAAPSSPQAAAPQPTPDSWWSDALADPWRDPDAAVVVVKSPQDEAPELEKPPPPSAGPRVGIGLVLVVSIVTALLAGALGGTLGYVFAVGGGGNTLGGGQVGNAPLNNRPPDSVAALVKKVLPSVVTISVRVGNGTSLGSGFVVSGDGHVITNNHVVEGSTGSATVRFSDASVATATVVGTDSESDIAVLKIDTNGLPDGKLVPVEFGNSDSVQVGDPVVAIGAPYDLEGTVTTGIISATHRPITAGGESDSTDVSYVDALQTDAPINPGNSGGPLVDADGLVIGINSAIRSADSGSDPFGGSSQGGSIGLGFSIPVNQAKVVATELVRTGRATHPVIGVSVNMRYTGDGAQVDSQVTKGGPGDKAGIRPKDVITAIDGERIHSGEEFIVRIRSHRPGDRLTLAVDRNGSRRTVRLTLGSATGG